MIARLLLLSCVLLAACGTVHDAAVTTFRVIDTPAHYVRKKIDASETTTTTTTTTTTAGESDVVTPGRPVNPSMPSSAGRGATQNRETAASSRTSSVQTEESAASHKPSPSATPRPTAKTAQFPMAKPVPGQPGHVYSIDPKGGIIDVTGYKSGDKAKDPYTKQIFIVP